MGRVWGLHSDYTSVLMEKRVSFPYMSQKACYAMLGYKGCIGISGFDAVAIFFYPCIWICFPTFLMSDGDCCNERQAIGQHHPLP